MNEPRWWPYFRTTAGTEDGATIARAAGVTPPQVSRWKSGKNRPDADQLARFARHYGRPPVEALVAAGYLTADEAAATIEINRALSDDELLAELKRRLSGVVAGWGPDDPQGGPHRSSWLPAGEEAGVLRDQDRQKRHQGRG